MRRFAHILISAGLVCCLLAGLVLSTTPARATEPQSLGTPTPPPSPQPDPTETPTTPGVPPTQPPATATPEPTATPPTATPRPTGEPEEDPSPTPEPTATPEPTITPEPWTTDVLIVKRADKKIVHPGDVVHYTLVASNIGAHTAFDVVVTDHVPASLEVIDLKNSNGDVVVQNQTVTAYVGMLEPGETAEIGITVRVRPDAVGTIPNIGQITTSTTGDEPNNNTSEVDIVVPPPHLPRTAETLLGEDDPLLGRIPPAAWAALVGVLLIALGGMMHLAVRGRSSGGASVAAATARVSGARPAASTFRLPSAAPSGPPRLGPALPPAEPPTPLPPFAPLDRGDALQDSISDGEL